MSAVDDAKKYLSLRPPMENKTIFALHPDVLVGGLLDEIERLRHEMERIADVSERWPNSLVSQINEIARAALKEGE